MNIMQTLRRLIRDEEFDRLSRALDLSDSMVRAKENVTVIDEYASIHSCAIDGSIYLSPRARYVHLIGCMINGRVTDHRTPDEQQAPQKDE